jgi:predicted thioesterase
MKLGLKYSEEYIVEHDHSALMMGSGDLLVLSTPALVSYMEHCAKETVKEYLNEDDTTVGISLNMSHVKASKIGSTIVCEAELINVEGRVLTFKVIAKDNDVVISELTHQRVIVNKERFMQKVNS